VEGTENKMNPRARYEVWDARNDARVSAGHDNREWRS
jgi:hypothetical protein